MSIENYQFITPTGMLPFNYTPQYSFSNFLGNFNMPSNFGYNFIPQFDIQNFGINFTNFNTMPQMDLASSTPITNPSLQSIESFRNECLKTINTSINYSLKAPIFSSTPQLTTGSYSYNSNIDTFTSSLKNNLNKTPTASTITSASQNKFVTKALSYVGKVNSDTEGNRLFSNDKNQPWCADFVSHIYKDSTEFKTSAVSDLRTWGINNGNYKEVPTTNKAEYIAANVKPGDIMIEKRNGKSHTGIVIKVNTDGSFETVEGNCSNKVKTSKYSANSSTLSGFIDMSRYA